jgi:hypothetical protein
MTLGKLLAIFLVSVSFSGVFAVESVKCSEINSKWNDKFHAGLSFKWPAGEFACPSAVAKAAKAVYDVWKPAFTVDYYKWIGEVTKGITYDMDCDYYAFNRGGEVTLCKKFFTSDDEARAATLIHEAAHSRGGDEGHVKCERGSNQGKDSCDQKLYERHAGSGYNYEFMYNTALLKVGNYNYLSKAVIKGWVKHEVMNNFNEVTADQVRRWTN